MVFEDAFLLVSGKLPLAAFHLVDDLIKDFGDALIEVSGGLIFASMLDAHSQSEVEIFFNLVVILLKHLLELGSNSLTLFSELLSVLFDQILDFWVK